MTDGSPGYDAYSGVPAIGDPGRTAIALSAGSPPRVGQDSADHEISASSFPGFEVRAASVRGLMHRSRGEPRQDRFSVVYDERSGTLVISVCDGVGQLGLSHRAAAFVAAQMPLAYLAHGNWSEALSTVNEQLTKLALEIADGAPKGSPPHAFDMATTFAGAAIVLDDDPGTASIAWSDDTSAWRLQDKEWTKLTVDTAHPDGTVHSTSVRALPHPQPRLQSIEVPNGQGALFVMSDGVGVPLEGAIQVREVLADWWTTPPDAFTFARQVGFARRSHLDDRTVVGIWFSPENEQPARERP